MPAFYSVGTNAINSDNTTRIEILDSFFGIHVVLMFKLDKILPAVPTTHAPPNNVCAWLSIRRCAGEFSFPNDPHRFPLGTRTSRTGGRDNGHGRVFRVGCPNRTPSFFLF
jgi:hypothetical protein